MLNVTGKDRVGITREVTKVLTKHEVEIMDLNQTVSQKKVRPPALVQAKGPRYGGGL